MSDPFKHVVMEAVRLAMPPEKIRELAKEILLENSHLSTRQAAKVLGVDQSTLIRSNIPRISMGPMKTRWCLKELLKGDRLA